MHNIKKTAISGVASLDALILTPEPIDPSWILSGQPQSRSGLHSASQDGHSSTNIWDCSAGALRWHFGWDETVLILEGSVRVTSPAGLTSVLKTGDVAYFPAETIWLWEVDTYVRKLAFHHRPTPRPLLSRIIRKIKRKLTSRPTATELFISIAATAASTGAIQVLE